MRGSECVRLRGGAIAHRDQQCGALEMTSHRVAHRAETDKSCFKFVHVEDPQKIESDGSSFAIPERE
jgi:hypothetical protein